ncbi:hypothetical protein ACHAWF_016786 [Thalassiosira exigua]
MNPPFRLRRMSHCLFALAWADAFAPIRPTILQRTISSVPRESRTKNDAVSCRNGPRLFLSRSDANDTGPKNESTSKNEFSRTIRVSKWFGAGGGTSSHRRRKSMDLSISATPSERHVLAARFRLTNITALTAEMSVQPAIPGSGGDGNIDGGGCIEARGTVCAQVTQTCVRTNEEFDVSLEFSFDTVLRAMASSRSVGSPGKEALSEGEAAALDAASSMENGRSRKKKWGDKQRGVKGVRGGQSIDDVGMKQLQDIFMEYEVTDEIIEDESCFCTDGIVDCGEIVAQMFRSKLDPYPKKPGTDPVSYSFTF